jgi:hypothetical protein
MKTLWCSVLMALLMVRAGAAQTETGVERQLDEVGRIASVMVDGDACRRIVTPRALEAIDKVNPRDRWASADNYDVDHNAYIQIKKTLMRLALLVPFPCDVNLWMPLPKNRVHIVIRNQNEISQFWTWGALHQEMFPPMKEVLDTGRRVVVKQKPGYISVLAPVSDSLGDIVGLVEVVAQTKADTHENVK